MIHHLILMKDNDVNSFPGVWFVFGQSSFSCVVFWRSLFLILPSFLCHLSLMEQKLLTLTDHPSSPAVFLYVVFCWPLDVYLFVLFRPLYCLSLSDLWLLIATLLFSIYSSSSIVKDQWGKLPFPPATTWTNNTKVVWYISGSPER